MEGSGRGLIEIQFQHLPRGTEDTKNFSQDSLCPDRDLNTAPPNTRQELSVTPTHKVMSN
jgi:hypothetical protein